MDIMMIILLMFIHLLIIVKQMNMNTVKKHGVIILHGRKIITWVQEL